MQRPLKRRPHRRLSRRALLSLALAALVLAAGLVCLLPTIKRAFPSPTAPANTDGRVARTLRTLDSADITTIAISHASGDSYTLAMREGALHLLENGEYLPLDTTAEADLRNALTVISAEDVVTLDEREVREHLSDMGLAKPETVAEISLRSGEVITVEIGGVVPLTGYSYLRVSGVEGVYMCSAGMAEALALAQNLLLPVESVVFSRDLITSVTLETAEATLTVRYDEGAALSSPVAYPADAEAASALLTALVGFRLGTREAALSPLAREAYGLNEPLCAVTVFQRAGLMQSVDESGSLTAEPVEARETAFVLGRAEGDYFYTCAYGDSVYLVSRFLVEPLARASLAGLASRRPADMGGAELSAIDLDTTDVSLAMRIAPADGASDDEASPTVTLNGELVPAEQYAALVDALAAMAVNGNAPLGWQPMGEPRWRVVLTPMAGAPRVVEGYRLNVFNDVVVVDGVALHTINAEEIDRAAAGV